MLIIMADKCCGSGRQMYLRSHSNESSLKLSTLRLFEQRGNQQEVEVKNSCISVLTLPVNCRLLLLNSMYFLCCKSFIGHPIFNQTLFTF